MSSQINQPDRKLALTQHMRTSASSRIIALKAIPSPSTSRVISWGREGSHDATNSFPKKAKIYSQSKSYRNPHSSSRDRSSR